MNILLENCKAYVTEDVYNERRNSAAEIMHIIVKGLVSITEFKTPNDIKTI